MIKIALPKHIRNKIIAWISKGKPYSKIIEKVEKEGYSISKGGITYIKKSHEEEENSEQNTEQESEQTKQKKIKSIESNENSVEEKSTKPIEISQISNDLLLTELEFKNLENAFQIVYNSNEKRLKNYRATGILNALNTVKTTIEIMKERGGFK